MITCRTLSIKLKKQRMNIENDDDDKMNTGGDDGYSYGGHLDGQKIAVPSTDMDPKIRAEAMGKFNTYQKWVFDRLPLTPDQFKDLHGVITTYDTVRPIVKRKKRRVASGC